MPSAVLAHVDLAAHHESTGNFWHIVDGRSIGHSRSLVINDAGEGSGAVLLIRFGTDGEELTDTWHASLDEAFEQAEFEYRVHAEEWALSGELD